MVEQRFASVDEYIASFPRDVQPKLRQVRAAIRKGVPDAVESISYHMPTYALPGWVLYFSGYKAHVSLHGAVERARPALGDEMARYEASGRGTLRLPLDEPMPVGLVSAVARESRKASPASGATRPTATKKPSAKKPAKRGARKRAK